MASYNRKHAQLARHIQQTPGISPKELAAYLETSVRVLRDVVKAANADMGGCAKIELERGQGYMLNVADDEAYNRWQHGVDEFLTGQIPTSPSERVRYLTYHLLERSDWVTLDELSNELFVSRAAISNDLKEVEETLRSWNLTLNKRPRYGIRAEGSELDRRLCLASAALSAYDDVLQTIALYGDAPTEAVGGSNLTVVRDVARCIRQATESSSLHLRSVSFQNLLIHIVVSLSRVKEGCYMPMDELQFDRLEGTEVWGVACDIAVHIEDCFGTVLPREEIAYIAMHLAGKQVLENLSDTESGQAISDEAWDVAHEMVAVIWEGYHFDLRRDLELHMNLARHIVPLSVRLRNRLDVQNPLLDDIRLRYPLAYSMACDASRVLELHYGSDASEREIGYIALALALALDRQASGPAKKNLLVVCASGTGTAPLLERRCRQEFGDYIDDITVCDAERLASIDFSHVDYVFTTVPLLQAPPVPVRQVSNFFDVHEADRLRPLIRGDEDTIDFSSILRRDLFLAHLGCTTREEALDYLCERAMECESLPANFAELVRTREDAAPVTFGNRVAIPHAIRPVSSTFFVCVAVLDHEIAWGENPVRVVFLLSIPTQKDERVTSFFNALSAFMFSSDAVDALIADQRYEKLLELFGSGASVDGTQGDGPH